MMNIVCSQGCCILNRKEYIPKKEYENRGPREKAGTVIMNKLGQLLIVQSNGNKWGFPKGSVKVFETPFECAIRETLEETGIDLREYSREDFKLYILTNGLYCSFFYIYIDGMIQVNIDRVDSDSTGIGWISIDCLKSSGLKMNRHFKAAFNTIFDMRI